MVAGSGNPFLTHKAGWNWIRPVQKLIYPVLLVAGGLCWSHFSESAPATAATQPPLAEPAPAQVMAPPGTYYVLSYFATVTDHGAIGWTPGQEVSATRQIADDPAALVVTDGRYSATVPRVLLTRDVETAADLRRADQASQEVLHKVSAVLVEADRASQVVAAVATARRIEDFNASLVAASTIGAFQSRLSFPAARVGAGAYDGGYRVDGSFLSPAAWPAGNDAGETRLAPAAGTPVSDGDLAAAVAAARDEAGRERNSSIPPGLISRFANDAFHLDYLGSHE